MSLKSLLYWNKYYYVFYFLLSTIFLVGVFFLYSSFDDSDVSFRFYILFFSNILFFFITTLFILHYTLLFFYTIYNKYSYTCCPYVQSDALMLFLLTYNCVLTGFNAEPTVSSTDLIVSVPLSDDDIHEQMIELLFVSDESNYSMTEDELAKWYDNKITQVIKDHGVGKTLRGNMMVFNALFDHKIDLDRDETYVKIDTEENSSNLLISVLFLGPILAISFLF